MVRVVPGVRISIWGISPFVSKAGVGELLKTKRARITQLDINKAGVFFMTI
jgi:hypothetical protein